MIIMIIIVVITPECAGFDLASRLHISNLTHREVRESIQHMRVLCRIVPLCNTVSLIHPPLFTVARRLLFFVSKNIPEVKVKMKHSYPTWEHHHHHHRRSVPPPPRRSSRDKSPLLHVVDGRRFKVRSLSSAGRTHRYRCTSSCCDFNYNTVHNTTCYRLDRV